MAWLSLMLNELLKGAVVITKALLSFVVGLVYLGHLGWLILGSVFAAISVWRLYRRKGNQEVYSERHIEYRSQAQRVYKKIRKIAPSRVITYVRKMSPYAFEELVLIAFEKQGYKIKRNQTYSHDGGIDGQVKIRRQWYLIQSKRYSQYINANHVKEFDDLCRQRRTKGYFIHTGRTGSLSKTYTNNTVIISGDRLLSLLKVIEQD